MTKRGTLTFIGGGPGDPELLTQRGARLLETAGLILTPGVYKDTFSGVVGGRESFDPFDYGFTELTGCIDAALDAGDNVAFLVPGDLAVFSPIQSLLDYYEGAKVIPGVGALNAASASLRHTFDMPNVSHSTIATSPKSITGSGESIGDLARQNSTMVLFMNNKPVEELAGELLRGYAPDTPVAVVYMASMPDEEVILTTVGRLADDIDRERFEDEDVYKLVVVGDVLTAREDPSWWDRRKDIRDKRHAERDAKNKK
jgi:precorrin-4/cobalt-precorrin-4 C11-methyltransferase